MTRRDPAGRPSAAKCLHLARSAVFEECFYSFAFGFFGRNCSKLASEGGVCRIR